LFKHYVARATVGVFAQQVRVNGISRHRTAIRLNADVSVGQWNQILYKFVFLFSHYKSPLGSDGKQIRKTGASLQMNFSKFANL
jgi:hypothetical protein